MTWILVLVAALVAVALLPPLRRVVLTGPTFAIYKRMLPAMSQTEREALEAEKAVLLQGSELTIATSGGVSVDSAKVEHHAIAAQTRELAAALTADPVRAVASGNAKRSGQPRRSQ